MANNSDYYRAQLESQARGREHAQHIEEYARMCQMMIEESVPILIEQYMAQKKPSVAFDVKTYLNGKFVDYKTELTNEWGVHLADCGEGGGRIRENDRVFKSIAAIFRFCVFSVHHENPMNHLSFGDEPHAAIQHSHSLPRSLGHENIANPPTEKFCSIPDRRECSK